MSTVSSTPECIEIYNEDIGIAVYEVEGSVGVEIYSSDEDGDYFIYSLENLQEAVMLRDWLSATIERLS